MGKFGWFLLVLTSCARTSVEPPPAPLPAAEPARAESAAGEKSAGPSLAATEASAPAESALGVVDRGVYADLDARIQLALPEGTASLTGLVDPRHALLVVYADGWPLKVYPLGSGPNLEARLRPGDRAELRG